MDGVRMCRVPERTPAAHTDQMGITHAHTRTEVTTPLAGPPSDQNLTRCSYACGVTRCVFLR
eukprot:6969549-Pyramimonas_sp.AAC.1